MTSRLPVSGHSGVRRLLVGLFFGLLILVGGWLHQDYGISWDEPQQRLIGEVSERYVLETAFPFLGLSSRPVPDLHEFRDKDYGVVFELPAVFAERLFNLRDTRDIYFFRHLLTFLVFVAGCYALYRMVALRFGDWRLGLLAVVLLVLSPRFFADAFYNSKDIVFMAAYVGAICSLLFFVVRPTVPMTIGHGLLSAIAIDVRIMAVIIPVTTLAVIVAKLLRGELTIVRGCVIAGVYLLATAMFAVLFFPYLWAAPLENLITAFNNMSQFGRWGGTVLYFAEFIDGTQLPWHYAPVWIAITTPIPYVLLALLGMGLVIWRLLRARLSLWRDDRELQDLLVLFLLCAPILAVIILQSVLYNGWRHLYFVYPALIWMMVHGWLLVWRLAADRRPARWLLIASLAVTLVWNVQWMVRAHPLQNVYFNLLAGSGDLRHRFELDYWGLANRQALEFILAYDASDRIAVVPGSFTPLFYSLMLLQREDRARLDIPHRFGPRTTDGPHYVIDNYQFWQRHYNPDRFAEGYRLVHQLTVNGEIVLSILHTDGLSDR